ncbi:uncharacterized protein LOC111715429 [Eurytemora carolleeae]|uniref:uncharacterized protein LOC111715429 n=1 Tax=Eurytemora carolleeae TaxID=1294199 RepID=UPI000C78F2FA|nr:uncharacterized protein LOC111715429 [Eurytemora carolleeae]|eukprot:XP_023346519.1 uncharacterized protein LOC111715429 [Eurytemora affinis]
MPNIDALAVSTDNERYWSEDSQTGPSSPTLSNNSSMTSSSPTPSSQSESSPDMSPEKSRSRSRKPYRMASSFELSDEQPELLLSRRARQEGDSYKSLFGPPPPRFPNRRSVSCAPPSANQRRSRKPLPVNPLTGDTLGTKGGLDIPSVPAPCVVIPNFSRFKRPPPGGYSSQLW